MMLAEKAALEQRIREPEEALKLAQQWRFGRKSGRLPASQKPLADEDAASDEADITRQLRDLLPPEEKTGRSRCVSPCRHICHGKRRYWHLRPAPATGIHARAVARRCAISATG